MRPSGTGKFQPTAPFVQFAFEVSGGANDAELPAGEACEVRVDNVNYSNPAYYVSPRGSDSSDGRTEKTAFATPQKALDLAQPGDIVLLMEGTYKGGQAAIASFPRPGMPDAWIVLKNYPGQHPTAGFDGLEYRKYFQRFILANRERPGPCLSGGAWSAHSRRRRHRKTKIPESDEQSRSPVPTRTESPWTADIRQTFFTIFASPIISLNSRPGVWNWFDRCRPGDNRE